MEAGDREFDLIVVGGGITGCGIAWEATLRGLRVALVELNDFASGTSSRSSRLIHGGVRYLEHGHLRLVFEASAERRRLLSLAPHLVQPLRFTWPVYAGARVPLWKLTAGLLLYDLLALFRNVGRHRRLGVPATRAAQPGLKVGGLRGSATYYDAATDDSRLTLAVALDARARGAVTLNHTRATGLVMAGGRATGIDIRDELTGQTASLTAAMIVNATGPWSDEFRLLEDAAGKAKVQGSKGVHIAVPGDRVGNCGALTLLSPTDGRVMFVLPAGAQTIVGTTDTFTSAPPGEIRANQADVDYLIAAANEFFPEARLTGSDVIAAWAGIRPLAASATGDSVAASREHVVSVTPAGVVTITGGKLTTFRVMAAETVDRALDSVARSAPPSFSDRTPLAWDLSQRLADVLRRANEATGDEALAAHLVASYGSAWPVVWSAMESATDGTARIEPGSQYRYGELRHACESELARTLGDLLIRRSRIAFETRDHGRAAARRVAPYVAPFLGWNAAETAAQIERYDREAAAMFTIDP